VFATNHSRKKSANVKVQKNAKVLNKRTCNVKVLKNVKVLNKRTCNVKVLKNRTRSIIHKVRHRTMAVATADR